MSAAILLHRDSYRHEHTADECVAGAARAHLETASDALTMALLSLSGEDDDRADQLRRVQQGRALLGEALTALSRARVYVPAIRTYTLSVLLATEPHADAELSRLHQLATRLIWQNHAYLPARVQAEPMEPEEEAQLALVVAGLARSARIDRALRYKWAGLAALVALSGTIVGLPFVGAFAATSALGLTFWQTTQERGPDLAAAPSASR